MLLTAFLREKNGMTQKTTPIDSPLTTINESNTDHFKKLHSYVVSNIIQILNLQGLNNFFIR